MTMEKYGVERPSCVECGDPLEEKEKNMFKGLCTACYFLRMKEKEQEERR